MKECNDTSATTRRGFLRLLPALPLALSAAAGSGCRTEQGGKARVRFWNGWTGPDGARSLALVRRFNQENPDIDVRMQRIDWGTYYNKLFVAGIAGRAPELFVLHTSSLRRFAEAKFLRPIDDLVAQGFPINDVDKNVWDATKIDGAHYGLPVDVHMIGMYYNKSLLQEAGFAAPPTDAASFREALRRITKGSGPSKVWGFTFSALGQTAFTLIQQFGGKLFNDDGTRCILNSPENAAALRFAVDLIQKDKSAAPPESTDAWVAFRQGRVGMTFNGIYMLPDLEKQKDLAFAGAPVPMMGTIPAVWASSHNFCLKANMDARHTEAAWRFARFYSDNSLAWAAGQVPVRKSVRAEKGFAEMPVQEQFSRQIKVGVYQPQLAFVFEFQTEFDYMVERVLRGTATPEAALKEAETNVNRIIARRAREKAEG